MLIRSLTILAVLAFIGFTPPHAYAQEQEDDGSDADQQEVVEDNAPSYPQLRIWSSPGLGSEQWNQPQQQVIVMQRRPHIVIVPCLTRRGWVMMQQWRY
jgi:hypothetical protein